MWKRLAALSKELDDQGNHDAADRVDSFVREALTSSDPTFSIPVGAIGTIYEPQRSQHKAPWHHNRYTGPPNTTCNYCGTPLFDPNGVVGMDIEYTCPTCGATYGGHASGMGPTKGPWGRRYEAIENQKLRQDGYFGNGDPRIMIDAKANLPGFRSHQRKSFFQRLRDQYKDWRESADWVSERDENYTWWDRIQKRIAPKSYDTRTRREYLPNPPQKLAAKDNAMTKESAIRSYQRSRPSIYDQDDIPDLQRLIENYDQKIQDAQTKLQAAQFDQGSSPFWTKLINNLGGYENPKVFSARADVQALQNAKRKVQRQIQNIQSGHWPTSPNAQWPTTTPDQPHGAQMDSFNGTPLTAPTSSTQRAYQMGRQKHRQMAQQGERNRGWMKAKDGTPVPKNDYVRGYRSAINLIPKLKSIRNVPGMPNASNPSHLAPPPAWETPGFKKGWMDVLSS